MSHLAWHETLELHELIAFQSTGLIQLKKAIPKVKDGQLKEIYYKAIKGISNNLNELLPFLSAAPQVSDLRDTKKEEAFYAGNLLGLAKTTVRNYAIAITETATPQLREVLQAQLNQAIKLHGEIYYYMYGRGLYPSYDLNRLLQQDQQRAMEALQYPVK